MILKIGNRASLKVASFEEASRLYAQFRDASLEGASTFPDGDILAVNTVLGSSFRSCSNREVSVM